MRKSGILMHITSLPGPYGIGTMGESARDFIDFLRQAGQSYWQILPLNPTGYGDSPYQSFSTFAGNPYLIDPDLLIRQGLLKPGEPEQFSWGDDPERVDFGKIFSSRMDLLRLAFSRFRPYKGYEQFVTDNQDWLYDYALFMALKEAHDGRDWQQWEDPLRFREPQALEAARKQLAPSIALHCFLQFEFSLQWRSLRSYARSQGIGIIGDIPIYVPLDSADVWANPELFQLDDNRHPQAVAGVPPDAFTADGQLWGNPLYNWEAMEKDGYQWWLRRLRAAGALYDITRLDHFRGFESYWSVPAGDSNARRGHWEKGPGRSFLEALQAGNFSCIAEDLGYVTPAVRSLQEASGYPSMKVLQFAFDSREQSDYLPHFYPVNSVCYSGTHDNLTLLQWLQEAKPEDVAMAKAYLGLNSDEGPVWGMIRGCMGSVSKLCIIQMQDYLELDGTARMNFPGTLSPSNWTWRVRPEALTPQLAEKIRSTTERYGRI